MLNWIEKRTGFVSMTKEFLMEDVPGELAIGTSLEARRSSR